MSRLNKINALAASVVAGALGFSAAHATGNPFAASDLPAVQLASAEGKDAEGKCGEGRCGEGMCGGMAESADAGQGAPAGNQDVPPADKNAGDKAAEGACGSKAAAEGACGNHK